ncbi:MauE/DoxX family redox-associated membrane protein [Phytohabitans houttuyneae]|uniref:Methylamine utilisation protein MauE domain-containing protein n=1 Tax=Phytohabitans houttuyneae TaxID=1076126 RepID=A0A6V8KGL8_9ACTN|nr:MauE/DoxX family redox-associated membrane protein [Phytohabitans houttuyneae]GFJ80837.1 hypothetical protein Phou_050170 [Phytohabitans houttuyneae]
MTYLQLASRGVLGFVMALAVVGKLSGRRPWRDFQASLGGFGWMPRPWWPAVAALVVLAEATVVGLVLHPATATAGLLFGGLLVLAVSVAVLGARRAGREVRCHCFGGDAGPIGKAHLARNVVLLLVCGTGAASSAVTTATPGPATGGLLLGLAGVAAVALSYPAELSFVIAPPARRS